MKQIKANILIDSLLGLLIMAICTSYTFNLSKIYYSNQNMELTFETYEETEILSALLHEYGIIHND